MAILKDLIVHGSSRFLNKIYAEELETSAFEAESAIIKKLTAKDATMENATVIGLLDVQGQLHTNTWTNSNIATIDGCFYITPTLSSDSGKISFTSNTAASLTGSYSAVTSLYIGGSSSGSTVQWTKDSNILLTGEVEVNGQWLPLGTLLGTLSTNATTSSIGLTGLTDNRHNPSSIITDIRNAVSSTALDYRNLKISLYQRKDGSDSKPIGIYMTAMGTNGKTFIDIYGGVNATTTAGSSGGFADPNLRIGNLSGLGAVEGTTPQGWGIYTTNGYFKGVIVSSAGKIGGWSIGTSGIYNGITGVTTTGSTAGTFIGTGGISNYKDTSTYVNIQNGVITAKGVKLTGQITATSGTIGGASISNGVLLVKDANISGKISANHIDASSITIGSLSGADNYALKEDVPTTVAELTDSGSYLTTSAASNTYATQVNLNSEINARKAVYGTSSTDAGTATKVVTCSNFALYTGASVTVTFSKTNTSSAPQMNVNSTGAKPIKSYTGANLTEGEYKWAAGASITFTYDGTNWRMQDGGALQAKIDAASSASTASSQAGVATQQATNATNAKTAAESAKTAAESAKTAAQSAKTAAETASSQASSAKDTAVSAKNDAVSAKTDAETAKGQAQTAASNASQSATNAANSATAAAEVMGGFTILWNYSAFGTSNNGRGYLCAFDPATGTKSDANGWVKWNGTKRTITKQLINPSAISPNNIPIYIVCRLSSSTATTGTNYMVWYNSGWKSATLSSPSTINSSWTWADSTDIILGKFVETASGAALTEYEIYNPPYTSKQITTNVVTAQSASVSATNAAKTATSYITYVNATDGIKVHNANNTSNYLQINSSAINFYRNNVETLKIENSAIRVGKIGENKQNVYITDGAVQIRDNEDILASFSADGVIVGKTDGSNVEINNQSMTMSVAENPIIQLRINNKILATNKPAGTYLLDINNAGTATVVIDNSKYNDFSNSSSISCIVLIGKDGYPVIRQHSSDKFTFGTSKTITYVYNNDEVSCKVSYDGEYTFRVTDCVNNNTEYPQTFLKISYLIEKNTASVILGATDQAEYYSYTVTEGYNCHATADYSHVEGYETQTSSPITLFPAQANHAEGYRTMASGFAAHAEGLSASSGETIASGRGSHAEGYNTKASGQAAHAEGKDTQANGDYSHAGGEHTYADRRSQMVIGEYNIRDTDIGSSGQKKGKYLFIIGNGYADASRSNAFTVDWNGNVQMYLDTVNVELDNSILTAIQSLGWEDDVID